VCQNSEGVSPIHYAAYHGHKDVVVRMLRHAPSIVDLCDNTGKTPLMLAAFRGRTQAVSALLKGFSNVNIQDTSGWTALMYAAFTGRIAICRELLEFAASRVIADFKTGKCAADLAQDSGYYEVADMLQNKEVMLRTPSLPDGVNMAAFKPVSRSASGSEQSGGRTPQRAALSSVLRPAIERALFPSLRRSPKTTSSPTRRPAKNSEKPVKDVARKATLPAATASSVVNLIAATPILPLSPVARPLYTPIAVAPEQQPHYRPLSGNDWGLRGNLAPRLGTSKAASISDRIKETISRASLMYLDSRTNQALKREEAASASATMRLAPAATNAVPRSALGHPPEAKYVNLGSAARRRKTTYASSRKSAQRADPYKRYHDSACMRPYWNAFSMAVTFWMPNFVLNKLLKKETAEKRQAWREKIALCFIILLITAVTAMISFGLSTMLCHPVDPISLRVLREQHGTNGTQKLTVIRGRIYDMTNSRHAAALGVSLSQLGGDASGKFAPFPEVSKRCSHWPQGKSGNNCYSVFGEDSTCTASKQRLDALRQLETNKWVAYQWNDVLHRNSSEKLFVYN
ncbi:Chitin synthase, class 3, partial [Coemansia sp. RSA 2611]